MRKAPPRREGSPAQGVRPAIRTDSAAARENRRGSVISIFVMSLIAVVTVITIIFSLRAAMSDGAPADTGSAETLSGAAPSVESGGADTEKADDAEGDAGDEPAVPAVTYASRSAATALLGDEIECRNAILIDVKGNTVVAEKGGDDRIFPASMTKVMTALVAVENCESLDETATVPYEVVAPLAAENATVAGLSPGDEVTVRDLVYGALLPSGADATGTLAVHFAGSEAEFAELMNKKCAELGLKNTHFANASGLHDDNHYSTCHDIAVIMEAAMQNEFLREVLGTYEYTITSAASRPEGLTVYSTVFSRVEGSEEFDGKISIIGGKTGYTGEAGQCLVSAARVEGRDNTYIFVCAGGESRWKPVYDTIHVYRTYLGVKYDGEYVPKSQR